MEKNNSVNEKRKAKSFQVEERTGKKHTKTDSKYVGNMIEAKWLLQCSEEAAEHEVGSLYQGQTMYCQKVRI